MEPNTPRIIKTTHVRGLNINNRIYMKPPNKKPIIGANKASNAINIITPTVTNKIKPIAEPIISKIACKIVSSHN
ncbi:MAG: hypothetical protein Q7U35_04625 [Methanobacteriaceae archaeon]|nr:hypothetical protein [Methanobacteriaceae archaeon]